VDGCVRVEPLRVGGFHRGGGGVANGGLVDKGQPVLGIVTTVLGLLAIFKHRGNIQRLLNGTEQRFGQKSATQEATK